MYLSTAVTNIQVAEMYFWCNTGGLRFIKLGRHNTSDLILQNIVGKHAKCIMMELESSAFQKQIK